MILDHAYISRGFSTSNQIRFNPIYLLGLGATSLYSRGFLLS